MSFLDLVEKRASCRRYCSREVTRESIERCLQAARLAPSACNAQPWRFIIIRDPTVKARVSEKAFSGIYQMSGFAAQAPVLIAVVRERGRYITRLGGFLRGVHFSLIDIGIAAEHFILQAADEGLGTCWIGWFNERATKKILGLSSQEKIDILISLGYADETAPAVKNRKLLSEICEYR